MIRYRSKREDQWTIIPTLNDCGGRTKSSPSALDTLRAFTSPDIVWYSAGTSQIDGVFTGRDEVFEWFARLQKEAGGTQRVEIHDALANDEHIVALVQWSARRGDRKLDQRAVHVFHVNPEGQLTEFWGFTEDTDAWNEFWS
jgi:ketosteroid isomerase-like protein